LKFHKFIDYVGLINDVLSDAYVKQCRMTRDCKWPIGTDVERSCHVTI